MNLRILKRRDASTDPAHVPTDPAIVREQQAIREASLLLTMPGLAGVVAALDRLAEHLDAERCQGDECPEDCGPCSTPDIDRWCDDCRFYAAQDGVA